MSKKNITRRKSSHDENRRIPDVLPLLREAIAQLDPTPQNDYLRVEVFSKFCDPNPGEAASRRAAAIRKLRATERNNEATNVRLLTVCEDFQILPRISYRDFMARVLANVTTVIGEVPPEPLYGGFSGGASTSRVRTQSHPALKYVGEAHSTPRFRECAEEIILSSHIWLDASNGIEDQRGNVLFTVPKSSDIDRCACKEPDINMYAQKGYGSFIRSALKKHKIDLNDQSRNRLLAAVGSRDGNLATMDLSSASDSISRELVFQALPIHWFVALDACRSPSMEIDGEWIDTEMFSSMGNGFTFELESLLFYAIARAVAYFMGEKGVISVYGDDIIIPVGIYHDMAWVLSFLGFETNSKKSFYNGPFRESCGGHFYNGNDITPFYVKGPVRTTLELINLLNNIRRWSARWGGGILTDDLSSFWTYASQYVPKRFWGGHDTTDRSRLVSYPSYAGYRLSPITRSERIDIGGYCLSLDGSELRRESTSMMTYSERVIETGRYRRKKVSCLGDTSIPFSHEMGAR